MHCAAIGRSIILVTIDCVFGRGCICITGAYIPFKYAIFGEVKMAAISARLFVTFENNVPHQRETV